MEHALVASIILFGALLLVIASGIWIAVSLLLVGLLALTLFTGVTSAGSLLATTVWDASWNWALTALPLFIWMGEILFRSRLSEYLFVGLTPWLGWLPGRLLHVNVVGCAIMAAVNGSSAVTCATVGRMSIPELKKLGYDENMTIGTLAGAGTLGLLIPPSIMMIVYGVVAEVSIARLFIAGVLPGIMLTLLFMAYVVAWALLYPDRTPRHSLRMTLRERIWSTRRLVPVVLLIILVIIAIYGGYATPTEAATVGVIGALILSATTGELNWASFRNGLLAATRTSCMLAFIVACAGFLAIAMGFSGIPRELAAWVNSYNLSPTALIVVLTILYIILGCFLDGISMLVLTASVVLPMAKTAGIDLLWFGIYIVIVVELAQITPPVGINLFVLQGLTGRNIWEITKMSFPFFCVMLVSIVIITVFPDIVMYLPKTMMTRQ